MSGERRWRRPNADIIRAAMRSLELSPADRSAKLDAHPDRAMVIFLRAEIAHLEYGLQTWPEPYADWNEHLGEHEIPLTGAERRFIFVERYRATGLLSEFNQLLAARGLELPASA